MKIRKMNSVTIVEEHDAPKLYTWKGQLRPVANHTLQSRALPQ